MKKFFAILLSAMLMLSLAVPAMAEGETETYSITIKNDVAGYTYAAYQIFIGDLSGQANPDAVDGTSAVLSNIKWGAGVTLKNAQGFVIGNENGANVYSTDAAKIAAALAKGTITVDTLLAGINLGTEVKTVNTQNSAKTAYVIEGLDAGYYLVKNTVVPTAGSYTEYIVEVVENSTVSPKADVPEVEKKVKDTNDTTGVTTDWQDSADHDIGDVVNFKLTATLPSNYSAYEQYKLTFEDTFEHFEQIIITSVYLANKDGNKIENATFGEADYDENIGTTGFTVTFANLKTSSIEDKIQNSYKVVVEYTAKLAADAKLGATGNPNKVKLIYSNNPNYEGNGENEPTGETPEDKVIVFTYKTVINKIGENKQPLDGAGFTLYKEVVADAAGNYPTDAKTGAEIKAALLAQNSSIKANALKADAKYITIEAKTAEGDDNTFGFEGIDDGTYVLVETTIPKGYNAWDAVEFEIAAEHDETSDDPKLISLTGGDLVTGEIDPETKKENEPNFDDGIITTDIVNRSGSTLPETGGMGTTIFYVVGGIMVVAAVVLLVTKKRMSAEG